MWDPRYVWGLPGLGCDTRQELDLCDYVYRPSLFIRGFGTCGISGSKPMTGPTKKTSKSGQEPHFSHVWEAFWGLQRPLLRLAQDYGCVRSLCKSEISRFHYPWVSVSAQDPGIAPQWIQRLTVHHYQQIHFNGYKPSDSFSKHNKNQVTDIKFYKTQFLIWKLSTSHFRIILW